MKCHTLVSSLSLDCNALIVLKVPIFFRISVFLIVLLAMLLAEINIQHINANSATSLNLKLLKIKNVSVQIATI